MLGDILICCPDLEGVSGAEIKLDIRTDHIRLLTRGIFTHAAIMGGKKKIYEATLDGVRSLDVDSWLPSFEYVVVLRDPYINKNEAAKRKVYKYLNDSCGSDYDFIRAIEIALCHGVPHYASLYKFVVGICSFIERLRFRKKYVRSSLIWSVLVNINRASDGWPGRMIAPSDFIDDALLPCVGYLTVKKNIIPYIFDINGPHY